ncbi:MAG: phosphoribosylformylglycinamidine cyclo-ligase [Actinomycetes bacterium]|nr:phosphoribosylformylglycinamidine cyclo-ligase [Actinomycetes bacterium]MDX5380809.1 phosphoribosylformylglycinamidine cyclo-ligase [Actinomycetes bacterium]MDX5399858.1 phosphoribosylformylglycinamidine cyclo-ligase [Actinomycetes bacterium]MDX5450554.1 phosphoribosylformylglycinamidine cyclo-ligase [Actinomycetes bacterium]
MSLNYAAAGVDTAAGDHAVELMRAAVAATHTPAVLAGAGGFAGMYDASALLAMKRPILATSTDGVGTKIRIAQAMGVHHTIGQDLVAMVVDDLVVSGATPLFMTDYIACGKVVPERIADIVRGIAEACAATGTALVGGETAEHPGVMEPDDYDVAGAATGVVDAEAVLGPHRVADGDRVVALASSGLHSNGYSLVRRIVEVSGWALDRDVPEFSRTLGEELLEPTRLYTRLCLAMLPGVHAFAHVTGGGLAANLARVVPAGALAVVDRREIVPPPVFRVLRELGDVTWDDLEGTFNLGVGMLALVPAEEEARVIATARDADVDAWTIGEVRAGATPSNGATVVSGTKGITAGAVALEGNYAG